MTPADEFLDMIALTLIPGLGPRLTQALLDHFGSASAARRATAAELQAIPHIGAKSATAFARALQEADPHAEIARAAEHNVTLVPRNAPDYPAALQALPDAPHVLYRRGDWQACDANAIGIVGSRKCSSYGVKTAGRLAAGLARAGYTVVSGLALGIDGAAHRGALEANGRTVAVLAGGLSKIYPPEHVTLADDVAKSGCLLTETPLPMQPQRGMFHARNRLISGLALAVIIIEANESSGALITARHAAEQGREVFAVPANVDSPFSAGSLRLLRDGARLIRDADDLLEDLRGLRIPAPTPATPPTPTPVPVAPPPLLEGVQRRLWEYLTEPRHKDEIVRALGLTPGELATAVTMLEMKKLLRSVPGGYVERR